MYANSWTKALSLHVSSIIRYILIRCISDSADRFNIEIHEVLVSNEYCLNFRIILKIFTNNVLINLSFCDIIILTLDPNLTLLLPINSPCSLQRLVQCMSQYVFNRAKYYSFKLDCTVALTSPFSSQGIDIITWCSHIEQHLDQIRNNISHQGRQRKMRVACTNDFSIIRLIITLKLEKINEGHCYCIHLQLRTVRTRRCQLPIDPRDMTCQFSFAGGCHNGGFSIISQWLSLKPSTPRIMTPEI